MVDIYRIERRPWYEDAPDHIMTGLLVTLCAVCVIALLPVSPIIALLYVIGKYANKRGWV